MRTESTQRRYAVARIIRRGLAAGGLVERGGGFDGRRALRMGSSAAGGVGAQVRHGAGVFLGEKWGCERERGRENSRQPVKLGNL